MNELATNQSKLNIYVKIGSLAYILWGVLHLWVGYEGINQFIISPNKGLFGFLIGAENMPVDKFQFAIDPMSL